MKDITKVVSKFETFSEAMPMIKALFGREDGNKCSNWDNFGTTQGYNPHDVKEFVKQVWDLWRKEYSWNTYGDDVWQVRELDKFWNTKISSNTVKNNMVLVPKNHAKDLNCIYFFQSLIRICEVKIKQIKYQEGKFKNSKTVKKMDTLAQKVEQQQKQINELIKAVEQLKQEKKTTLNELRQRYLKM